MAPKHVEPVAVDFDEFPDSPLTSSGMQVIHADHTPGPGVAALGVPYATKDGRTLHLQVLFPRLDPRTFDAAGVPQAPQAQPLVVYVQGSAWGEQFLGSHLPPHCGVGRLVRRP